jgi:hypothetical protein
MKSFPVFLVIIAFFVGVVPYQSLAATRDTPSTLLQRQTSKLKGSIKSIDTASAVIVPSDNKRGEIAFRLTATTERSGSVASGDVIEVVYYFDQGQRVATALIGKTASQ